jgi:hypothetical protein
MLTLLAVLAPRAIFSAAREPQSQSKAQEGSKKVASGASLSGCVDQQDGRYVLVDDRSLEPVADLEADGFATESFAKHMGHKVTIRGTSNSGSTRPLFKVRTIETVSETCAPTPQPDKK